MKVLKWDEWKFTDGGLDGGSVRNYFEILNPISEVYVSIVLSDGRTSIWREFNRLTLPHQFEFAGGFPGGEFNIVKFRLNYYKDEIPSHMNIIDRK